MQPSLSLSLSLSLSPLKDLCCNAMICMIHHANVLYVRATHRAQDVMDVYVLFDAITACISSDEKELCKIGQLALGMVIDTAATIVGDREKASELLLFEVVADKVCGCCYERAWYAKNGG